MDSRYWIPGSWSVEPGFRIPIVRGITDSLRRIFRIPKPRIPDSTTKICWIPDSTSQNFPDAGIWNPLLGREVTLSGICVPSKDTACTVNSLPLFELYIGQYFEKKFLILENNVVRKSRTSEVLSQLKAKPSGHPLQISTKFGTFYSFPKDGISFSTTLFS